ncbi:MULTISPECIES: hypothetical protein [unclassified Caulobacter]|uniref:hypothetical protein n=1 Tax=unclassified Caulobacter TaxID=2648921 RepID=UPI000D331950|nr:MULTISPECIES: hypothetical protein [unclassified Caulobacter]PTS89108.1 hypothetical protein DBR21_07510 [Caulobacter sp. HMWF009]PTT05553.1 hypothetical protein DBR10_15385 [Caulobacter sp. HMWF025]
MTVASKFPKFFASPKVRMASILAVCGGFVGFGSGMLIGKLEKAGAMRVEGLGWSDLLSGLIALMLIALGVMVLLVSASRKTALRVLDPGNARDATPAQASYYRQQGLVALLAGVMLAAPVLANSVFDPLPFELGAAVMAGIVALFLVQTVGNLILWQRSDELVRQVMSETGAVSFWLLQGPLFLWAAGEKLNLLPALSLWDAVAVLMASYLLISTLVSARRGLGG